jgi:hypothetical protein
MVDEQVFNQMIAFCREFKDNINTIEVGRTPAELSEKFIYSNINNTGDLWQSLFLIGDELKSILELYDNSESGFFLALPDEKKEEIFTSLVYLSNSKLNILNRIKNKVLDGMNNTNFPGMEEDIEITNRLTQYLIDNNLYTASVTA